jgi:uncharacterized protein affecting Mg2+/Co2+ transport
LIEQLDESVRSLQILNWQWIITSGNKNKNTAMVAGAGIGEEG